MGATAIEQEVTSGPTQLAPPGNLRGIGESAGAVAATTAVQRRGSKNIDPPLLVEPPTSPPIARPPLRTTPSASSGIAASELNSLLQVPVSPASSPSVESVSKADSLASTAQPPSYAGEHDGSVLTRDTSARSFGSVPPAWLGTTSAPVSDISHTKGFVGYSSTTPTLKRDYDSFALFGLTLTNLGFLQGTLFGAVGATAYGGSSLMSIGWPISGLLMSCTAAVMAELASAFPVAGAMMTWTFRLARSVPALRASARFLSWVTGSFLLCGHVLTQVLLSYQMGTVLHGTVRLYHQDYRPSRWAVAGVSCGIFVLAMTLVMSAVSRSPWLWRIVVVEIFAAFLALIISLGSSSTTPLLSAEQIFTGYSNETGFDSKGMVYLIGWVQSCLAIGQDVAVHMSEETKNPHRAAPWAVFWSTFASFALGWVSLCVILAASATVDLPEGQLPHTSLFAPGELLTRNLPQGVATAIIILLLIAMFFQNVSQLLGSSRYCWALARDDALPFSSIFKRVSGDRIPRYAILFLGACVLPGVLLVATIRNVVTTVALQGAGFTTIFAYFVPIVLYIVAGPDALDVDGRRQFSLRKASIPMAWLSALFLGFALVIFCFPTSSPVDIYSLSWSPVILGGVFILSCLSWIFYGNVHYAGPIKAVLGPDVELPRFAQLRSQGGTALATPAVVQNGTSKKHSEPGTTKIFLASGAQPTTLRSMTETGWTSEGGLETEWEEDEDEVGDEEATRTRDER